MSEYPADHKVRRVSAAASDFNTPIAQDLFAPLQAQLNPAAATYHALVSCIFEFEKQLDEEHEIGARLLSSDATVTFYLQNVGSYHPDIITFSGRGENGGKLQLVQHASRLNVLLIEMKKRAAEPVRIGFKLKREAEAAR